MGSVYTFGFIKLVLKSTRIKPMQLANHRCERSLELSDSALLASSLAGDDLAFECIVQRYQAPLYNFIRRSLGDYEQAFDVVQFVFMQLYISLPKLYMNLSSARTKTPLKSWLFQVAWNRCMDELRKNRPLVFSELEVEESEEGLPFLSVIPDNCPLPEEIAEQHDLRCILCRAIETLPPKFRLVVSLRYTRDLSFMEIGNLLHMPENTAKTYFQRARPLLRQALVSQMQPVLAVS
jgi:RNA polymerase sigma-70 factor (ECF subfamily)